MELPQHKLIQQVKDKCIQDNRLDAALTYGSFTKGEGDRYSDIEFWLFFNPEEIDDVDQEQWIKDIAPIYWSVINEYGTRVAFFKDHLIRGEFHFVSSSTMSGVKSWPAVEPDRVSEMVSLITQTNCRAILKLATRRSLRHLLKSNDFAGNSLTGICSAAMYSSEVT